MQDTKVKVLGIDLSKNVFQLHGVDKRGKAVLRKQVKRSHLKAFIACIPKCLIGLEACGSAHYWARTFKRYGHEVKIMAPQFVKPYIKSNKNDAADAEAICEAVSRPSMRFVGIKSVEQQDIQCIHRIRQRLVKNRTALGNEIRGFLLEYGIAIPKGLSHLQKLIPVIVEDEKNELTSMIKEEMRYLLEELLQLHDKVKQYELKLKAISRSKDVCKRLEKIPGVGPMTSTAIWAATGDPNNFKNGRAYSAWLGLVPKQYSTGGKVKLLGISKRGDKYIRSLLVHGARSRIIACKNKEDKQSLWIKKVIERRGKFKAYVALANKNARVIWKLMATGEEYKAKAA